MNSDKLLWYLNRLRSMPKREVLHRVREAVETRKPFEPSPKSGWPTLIHSQNLSDGLRDAWIPMWSPSTAGYCRDLAEKALNGSAEILGQEWSTSAPRWNVDPVSGYVWPSEPAHRIDYRHSSGADPKWVWEINRLLFVLPVAFATQAGEIKREQGEAFIEEILLDWMLKCPAGIGPQWAAAIEVAIRSIVLTICAETLRGASEEFHSAISKAIFEHAMWIKRFPSAYSSANNHRVAEVAALLLMSSSWSQLLSSDELKLLEDELISVSDSLFASDGIGLEQSPTYAGFSLEFLALVLRHYNWLSQRNYFRARSIAARGAYALGQFTNEDGSLIRYGDDDEGKVVTVVVPNEDYANALCRLAVGKTPDRKEGLQSFNAGGISLVRFNELGGETTWTLDHGPLGFGAIAAHGHADVLSMTLRAVGIDWLVDAGTYKYHGDKKWRTYFRSSRAHNAPQLNELDSSLMTGDFNWDPKKRAEGALVFTRVDNDIVYVKANHDGYRKLGLGLVSRTFERLAAGNYRITDEHTGESKLTSAFVVNPACTVVPTNSGWRVSHPDSPIGLDMTVSEAYETFWETPADQSAWYSPKFGEKVPAWRIGAKARASDVGSQIVFQIKFLKTPMQEAQ